MVLLALLVTPHLRRLEAIVWKKLTHSNHVATQDVGLLDEFEGLRIVDELANQLPEHLNDSMRLESITICFWCRDCKAIL